MRSVVPAVTRAPRWSRTTTATCTGAGRVRRIVARAHSLLDGRTSGCGWRSASSRRSREPATPTCSPARRRSRLGIDIGDLSMVALTSLPRSTASYLQRVGRAGRLTGSSLVLSLLPAPTLELQRLVGPAHDDRRRRRAPRPATSTRSKSCAASTSPRSSTARRGGEAAPDAGGAMDVFAGGLAPTSYLGRFVSDARATRREYVDEFLPGSATRSRRRRPRSWSLGRRGSGRRRPGVERAVERACNTWMEEPRSWRSARRPSRQRPNGWSGPVPGRCAEARPQARAGELGAIRQDARPSRGTDVLDQRPRGSGAAAELRAAGRHDPSGRGLWWTDEESGAAERSDDTYVRGSRTALRNSRRARRSTSAVRRSRSTGSTSAAAATRRPRPSVLPLVRLVRTGRHAITACPRCDDPAAADTGQILQHAAVPQGIGLCVARARSAGRGQRRPPPDLVLGGTTVDADPATSPSRGAWRTTSSAPRCCVVRTSGGSTWVPPPAVVRPCGSRDEEAAPRFRGVHVCGVVWAAQRGVHSPAGGASPWLVPAASSRPAPTAGQRRPHPRAPDPGSTAAGPAGRAGGPDPAHLVPCGAAPGLRQVLGGDPDHLDVVDGGRSLARVG